MVSFSKLLRPIALGFATWATTYAAEEIQAQFGAHNVTLMKGTVQGGSHLTERSIPPECSFATARGDFTYVQIKPASGTACVGWDNWFQCGNGQRWADPDFTDIQTALSELIAMDGQWSSSQAGAWQGTFWLGTTAFAERDTTLFDLYFATQCDTAPTTIYWSRNGDFATLRAYENGCP